MITLNKKHCEETLKRIGWTVTDAGCWEWKGARHKTGYPYGQVGAKCADGTTRSMVAHRLAYTVWVGPIPEGLIVMHSCDNPPCLNPAHLSTGTQTDNMRDMAEKGRDRHTGSKNPRAVLNEAQVAEIRAMHVPGKYGYQRLADDFNVSKATVAGIIAGRTWTS